MGEGQAEEGVGGHVISLHLVLAAVVGGKCRTVKMEVRLFETVRWEAG